MRRDEVKEKLKEAVGIVLAVERELGIEINQTNESTLIVAAFNALCDEYPDYLLTEREKTPLKDAYDETGSPLQAEGEAKE